jgi:DNA-binding beta-propeller fold protein YncE
MTTTKFELKYLDNIGFCADFGGRGFQLPTSMAIRSDGTIFVASRGKASTKGSNGIQLVTNEHDFLGQIGTYGSELGGMIWPTSLVLDLEDNLYLADEYLQRITKFDREGNAVTHWGEKGHGPGQFDQPSGMLVKGEELLIVDSRNNRVQIYSLDGEYIGQWGSKGNGEGEFDLPWGICDDSEGNVYVADWRNDRIQKFDYNGNYIKSIGQTGSGKGQFNRPSDMAVDKDGNIYVADWGNQRVQVVDSDGEYLDSHRGAAHLNPWSVEYLSSQDDERAARESFVPVYDPDTDDQHEISARMEPYLWDPVAVELGEDGKVYVVETGRHRFQVFEVK